MSEISKICQIADIQFRNFQRHDEFKSVCEKFLYDMEFIQTPDRIVICGDLVHSKNQITPELIDIVSWFLKSCADICRTIIILGNHDYVENNHERLDPITPIVNNLQNDNLIYYKNSGVYSDENVNWVVYSLLDGNKRPDELGVIQPTNKINVGLYHGPVYGMRQDASYVYEYGARESTFKGCHIVLAGDIHLRQVVTHGDIPILMVGSFVQQSSDEPISGHGYGVIELPSMKYGFVDIPNPVKYMKFKINDFLDISTNSEILLNP